MYKKQITNLFILFTLIMPLSYSKAETVFLKGTAYQSGITAKELKVGSSEVMVSNAPIKRVAVTDPSVADIRVLSETTALVRGKRLGRTSLLIWEGKDSSVRPTRFDITVKRDISDLIARIKLIDPNIDIEYVIIPSDKIESSQAVNSNATNLLSYKTVPETVGDPAPSLFYNNAQGGTAGASGGGGGKDTEKIILTGRVKNGDSIIKAITIASTYLGEQGSIKVLSRTGGLLADQIGSVLTSGGGGGGDDVMSSNSSFSSNLQSNVINGSIVSNSSGSVISFLQIFDKPQVAVKVRFYEVTRSIGKSLKAQVFKQFNNGINLAMNGPTPSVAGQQLGLISIPSPNNPGSFIYDLGRIIGGGGGGGQPLGAGGNFVIFPKWNLEFVLEALERRGEAKILAEPTIVTISGEIGEFRAGGEIPVAQAQSSLGAIAQSYRYIPYGIGISILPTVTDNDSILMNLKAITRDLDMALGQPGSPAFKTRKVDTQVEMDPSQALVLAGLINSTSSRELGKIPLIGDVPVLGVLFRSKDFQRGNTELIIVLSPEIVRPGQPNQVVKPLATDRTNDHQFDWMPTTLEVNKTSIPVTQPPMTIPNNGTVDMSRPTMINDLDQLYH